MGIDVKNIYSGGTKLGSIAIAKPGKLGGHITFPRNSGNVNTGIDTEQIADMGNIPEDWGRWDHLDDPSIGDYYQFGSPIYDGAIGNVNNSGLATWPSQFLQADSNKQPISQGGSLLKEFEIVRGTSNIPFGSTSVTITEGVDYNLNAGSTINNSFIYITNTLLTGGGRLSDGDVSDNVDHLSAYITNPTNLTTSINFVRATGIADTNIAWEILQYIGDAGNSNEIIVRNTNALFNVTSTPTDGTILSNISESGQVCVFITSQSSNWTNHDRGHTARFTSILADAGGGNFRPRLTHQQHSTVKSFVSYAVIEFVGSNWRDVQRLEFSAADHAAVPWSGADPNSTGVYSLPLPLLDTSKSFLHHQTRYDGINYQASSRAKLINECVEIIDGNLNTLRIRAGDDANDIANRYNVVWIMENTGVGDGAISVDHVSKYAVAGINNFTSTEVAVSGGTTMDSMGIMGQCHSNDYNTPGYAMTAVNVIVNSTTGVLLNVSTANQNSWNAFDLVNWPRKSSTSSEAAGIVFNSGNYLQGESNLINQTEAAICVSFNPDVITGGEQALVTSASGTSQGYFVSIESGVLKTGYIGVSGNVSYKTYSGLTEGQGNVITALFDESGNVSAYVNSYDVSTPVTEFGVASGLGIVSGDMFIGAGDGGSAKFFSGTIYSVAVDNREWQPYLVRRFMQDVTRLFPVSI